VSAIDIAAIAAAIPAILGAATALVVAFRAHGKASDAISAVNGSKVQANPNPKAQEEQS
jgi:hypothetical protein